MSVYGTGSIYLSLEVFLGSLLGTTITSPEGLVYCQDSARTADLPTMCIPTPFNDHIRPVASLTFLRHSITINASTGILTSYTSVSPFGFALVPD